MQGDPEGVVLVFNDAGLRLLLESPEGATGRELARKARRVETRAKQLCPVDTGRLRSSIFSGVSRWDGRLVGVCGTNVKYAPYVELGTGIYGPRRSPIVPRSARLLRWTDKGGDVHFARSVRGMRARPFLRPALAAAR